MNPRMAGILTFLGASAVGVAILLLPLGDPRLMTLVGLLTYWIGVVNGWYWAKRGQLKPQRE